MERILGRGGMGDVYLARDRRLGRSIALKVMRDEFLADEQYQSRFEREVQSAAALNHPHIVQVYDSGVAAGLPYLCMEFVEGPTLQARLVQSGPFMLERALDVADQILSALGYAHSHGVVHRDVKPQNVLLDSDGRAKLTDFGIAWMVGQQATTATGAVVGSASYLSPEQAQGETPTPQSDLYSLGSVLFAMLSGRPPFEGPTPFATANLHVTAPPPSLASVRADLPPSLDAVLSKALAKRPLERYADAQEFREALAATVAGVTPADIVAGATSVMPGPPPADLRPIDATRVAPRRSSGRAGPRRWATVAAVVLALLLLGISTAVLALGPDDLFGGPAAPSSSAPTSATTNSPSVTSTTAPRPQTTVVVPVAPAGSGTNPVSKDKPNSPKNDQGKGGPGSGKANGKD